jgi:hypothetical protein
MPGSLKHLVYKLTLNCWREQLNGRGFRQSFGDLAGEILWILRQNRSLARV